MFHEVRIGEADELLLLGAVDGLESLARALRLPRLHFGDDERPSAPGHQVDLAASEADVRVRDGIAAQTVEPPRPPLAAAPELVRVEALICDGSAFRCRSV